METEAPQGKKRWYHDLSVVRWIFAVFGILIMAFTGGCSLFFLVDLMSYGTNKYYDFSVVLFIGGLPFLFGLVVWFLAAKVGRTPQERGEE